MKIISLYLDDGHTGFIVRGLDIRNKAPLKRV
jgi:hypothetical protein